MCRGKHPISVKSRPVIHLRLVDNRAWHDVRAFERLSDIFEPKYYPQRPQFCLHKNIDRKSSEYEARFSPSLETITPQATDFTVRQASSGISIVHVKQDNSSPPSVVSLRYPPNQSLVFSPPYLDRIITIKSLSTDTSANNNSPDRRPQTPASATASYPLRIPPAR
jgi:hypothetical protein